MISRPANEEVTVFRYPLGIRLGYPFSLAVWALLPVLPILIWAVVGWTQGVTYRFTLQKYYANPWLVVIFGSVWLWAVYMLYLANLSRSEIKVSEDTIGSASVVGTRTMNWSDVREIVKRRQVVNGNELFTFFVRAGSRNVVFSNRLIDIDNLLVRMNAICGTYHVPLYYEDYEARPIAKVRIPKL